MPEAGEGIACTAEVRYRGLVLLKAAAIHLDAEEARALVMTDEPMPIGTELELSWPSEGGDQTRRGRVEQVIERPQRPPREESRQPGMWLGLETPAPATGHPVTAAQHPDREAAPRTRRPTERGKKRTRKRTRRRNKG